MLNSFRQVAPLSLTLIIFSAFPASDLCGKEEKVDAATIRIHELSRRFNAAQTPSDFESLAMECVRRLRQAVGNNGITAAQVLLQITEKHPEAAQKHLPKLLKLLNEPKLTSKVRCYEFQIVGLIGAKETGAKADGIAAFLQKILSGPPRLKFFERAYATQAILRIRPDHQEAYSSLIAQAKSDEPTTRWLAAYIMGELPKLSDQCLPILEKMLEDPDPAVRVYAAGALSQLWPQNDDRLLQKIIDVLADAVNEEGESAYLLPISLSEWTVPHNMIAAGYLRRIGPPAKRALPALLQALKSPEAELRMVLPEAIAAIGSGSPAEIDALTNMSKNDELQQTRDKAKKAVGILKAKQKT